MAKLSRAEFYQVCEKIKELKEFFGKEKPLMKKAAEIISAKLGLAVSPITMKEACEVSGVHWDAPAGIGGGAKVIASMRHQLDMFAERLNLITEKILAIEDRISTIEDSFTKPRSNGTVGTR